MSENLNLSHPNHLKIGGVDVLELVKNYQTPLYVMDETKIRKQCQTFMTSFKHKRVATEVIYASKAFLNIAMCELIQEEGLSLDVVSGGELFTAISAGFPVSKIFFHGNNKSIDELKLALEHQIKTIVLDNADELNRLSSIIKKDQKVRIMLRINPGIDAHTHEYIRTTKNDSKFGVSIFDPKTLFLIQSIHQHPSLEFVGFHSHIGSQIFEENSFKELAITNLKYIAHVYKQLGIETKELNLGGGFGAHYTKEDKPFVLESFLPQLLETIDLISKELDIKTPKILIEPGRAIVAEAGYTLYTISGTKETFGGKNFVFTDGSMADHLRTALYQAKYHATIGNRVNDTVEKNYTVTGKACESGDIIIKEIMLPVPKENDILVVYSTGAYHYSMSSNYNRLLKPAVVFASNGKSKVVVKRETYLDLIRNDLRLGK